MTDTRNPPYEWADYRHGLRPYREGGRVMECQHKNGDFIQGNRWLCGVCFSWLSNRPVTYRNVRVHPAALSLGRDRVPAYRQEAFYAPIAVSEGFKLSSFIEAMARRLVARTRGGMGMSDAREYAVCLLRDFGEPFGSEDLAWDEGGACELVDEDMSYWDSEKEGNS